MRHLLLTLAVLAMATAAVADEAYVPRTTIGDVPRTYTHFMNAQEAALCRSNAAAGGVSAYFFNPAVIGAIEGVSGQATLRMNLKTRDYLPSTAEDDLEATDDSFLFSQAVAAKNSEMFAFGIGYSCPSYRRLEFSGTLDGNPYTAEFGGSLRFFELVGAARIGSDGSGVIGAAVGIANLEESAREKSPNQFNRTSEMDGMSASLAIGILYEIGERVTLGGGYRFGTKIDVDGEWHTENDDEITSGTTQTEPVAVLGASFTPVDMLTVYATYMNEGWNKASSTFAPYYDIDPEPRGGDEDEGERDEFSGALSTLALGAEATTGEGRITVRVGYSMPVGTDLDNDDEPEYRELVPEYAYGFGGTFRFNEYSVDLAFSGESYADGDEGGVASNNGVYLTVGYDF